MNNLAFGKSLSDSTTELLIYSEGSKLSCCPFHTIYPNPKNFQVMSLLRRKAVSSQRLFLLFSMNMKMFFFSQSKVSLVIKTEHQMENRYNVTRVPITLPQIVIFTDFI